MDERIEWLKAQIEAYYLDEHLDMEKDASLTEFLTYMERKFRPKGFFERFDG